MDSSLKLEYKDVDPISGTPTHHLSFIIQQLLPERLVGKKRCEGYLKHIRESSYFKEEKDTGILIIPTGSLAEGLNMPPVCSIKTRDEIKLEDNTDTDIMQVLEKYPVTFSREQFISGKCSGLVETEEMRPSYVKINTSKDIAVPRYASRTNFLKCFKYISAEQLNLSVDDIEINGPAITTMTTKKKGSIKTKLHVFQRERKESFDTVIAFPCKEWPPAAESWIRRQKAANRIDAEIIDSLVKDGCHVVPAAHRSSAAEEYQWRLSFAATEGRIAREVITDKQRQAYVCVKILYNHALKQKEILTSYQLKTVFLYACELLPDSCWAENVGTCVLFMLDLAIECIQKKRIPSFFIQENNLIDYFTSENQEIALRDLKMVRANPVKYLLDFTDDKFVGFGCFDLSFRNMAYSVLEDMKEYLKHRDIKRSILDGFLPMSIKNLSQHMTEGTGQEETVHIAEDLHAVLVANKLTEENFGEFCLWNVAVRTNEVDKSADFLEKVIEMHQGASYLTDCHMNIPALFHAASYRYPPGSEKNKRYIAKADEAFKAKREFQSDSDNACGDCDYALFLIKQHRADEAIDELKNVIDRNNLELANFYDTSELMTLDDVLQTEVIEHNKFSAPSVSLAFYLLIDVLFNKGKGPTNEVTDLLQRFKEHADEVKLPRTFALYGYSCMLLSEWSRGMEAFNIAYSTNMGAEYTRALKMKRYCERKIKKEI